jgi:hypothetical protein
VQTKMSSCLSVDDIIKRLQQCDTTLTEISVYTDCDNSKIAKVVARMANNKRLKKITLMDKELVDPLGLKIIEYVACSSKLDILSLSHNKLTELTIIALADALCVNSSLRVMYLHNNCHKYSVHIDIAFVNALRLNPRDKLYVHRRHASKWCIYTHADEYGWYMNAYPRLKSVAEKSSPPSMLEFLLRAHSGPKEFQPKKLMHSS